VNALVFLLPLGLILGCLFAVLFVIAARRGQFEDLDDPPERMLRD
jgi:cbb3-type cytochrome oxidase maturation protein